MVIQELLVFLPLLLVLYDVNLLGKHNLPVLIDPECILHLLAHYLPLVFELSLHLLNSFLVCLFLVAISQLGELLILLELYLVKLRTLGNFGQEVERVELLGIELLDEQIFLGLPVPVKHVCQKLLVL